MGRGSLGEFEHQVMLTLLRHGSESYSVDVVAELEARTGREYAVSAVFVALARMEEKGLLLSRMVAPAPDEGGHARRYFALTRAGMSALRESRRAYLALWEGFEPVLDEG
jgi:PadR family transcriptional regulator